ncbi:hypothetical protein TNCV_2514131 [Trichonephila clavipes]|nr:hypothetical protein TNCV_2514131 [Trichonephila clavipes]
MHLVAGDESNSVGSDENNLQCCVGLENSATKTYKVLKHVYGSAVLSRTQDSEWHRRFGESRESVKDDECSGRP